MKFSLLAAFLAATLLILVGCGPQPEVYNVPSGYVAKVLTPTGWQNGIQEAGQIDLGAPDMQGRGNQLVFLEASAARMKESFAAPGGDNTEDHRVLTRDKTPIAVDFYVQVAVPSDKATRDSIFAQITPTVAEDNNRVGYIYLHDVYEQFASPIIRGKTREIFSKYGSYTAVMDNYSKVNDEIALMVAQTFKQTQVPLKLVAAQLSNVKADSTIWEAENKRAAAVAEVSTIEAIGKAIRENPGYLQKYKWDVLREAAGKGTTIIVSDGEKPGVTLPVR